MKLTICGARGSYPVARPDQTRYGGNTSCHLFQADDATIIFDLGTGARNAGKILMEGDFGKGRGQADIFVTHVMWDHIIGMPFFDPLFVKGNVFRIYSPRLNKEEAQSIFAGLYDPAYFPVPMSKLAASIDFIEIDDDQSIKIAPGIEVSSVLLNHPGVTLGYRLNARNRSFCYITDTASWFHPLLSERHNSAFFEDSRSFRNKMHKRLVKFVKNADWLMMDTHFSDDAIPGREDWGHASPGYAVNVARQAKVEELLLYHHDPDKGDIDLERTLLYVKDMAGDSLKVSLARENAVIDWKKP